MSSAQRVVITPGEPAGIGPDLVVQLAQRAWPIELVVCADGGGGGGGGGRAGGGAPRRRRGARPPPPPPPPRHARPAPLASPLLA